eukprot:CAMPEP_0171115992 /NCGR_PEP_ID=MMETSP0766_2-20121228/89300_1 /TAXON_ID=439317 /ORGANISM="Gambierdiscus australes, Strain CAWD 149" /LENGTH=47 /DNA_ID= /DNA_START= /DNA_END= /DNA_ORIENTATION=
MQTIPKAMTEVAVMWKLCALTSPGFCVILPLFFFGGAASAFRAAATA